MTMFPGFPYMLVIGQREADEGRNGSLADPALIAAIQIWSLIPRAGSYQMDCKPTARHTQRTPTP